MYLARKELRNTFVRCNQSGCFVYMLFISLQGVKIYSVQCLACAHADEFYRSLAQLTQGQHIHLEKFDHVVNLILAVSYGESFGIKRVLREKWEINVKTVTGKTINVKTMSDSTVIDLKVRGSYITLYVKLSSPYYKNR